MKSRFLFSTLLLITTVFLIVNKLPAQETIMFKQGDLVKVKLKCDAYSEKSMKKTLEGSVLSIENDILELRLLKDNSVNTTPVDCVNRLWTGTYLPKGKFIARGMAQAAFFGAVVGGLGSALENSICFGFSCEKSSGIRTTAIGTAIGMIMGGAVAATRDKEYQRVKWTRQKNKKNLFNPQIDNGNYGISMKLMIQ